MKKNNDKTHIFFILFIIVSIIALLLIIISSLVFLIRGVESSTFADIATIISVVLAVVSILYTYKSGEETLKNLDEISKQSESLVNQIIRERSRDNFDDENVKNVLSKEID